MQEPATPDDEAERLAALRELDILDTPPEARFDRLTEAAAAALGTPCAMLSLVDEGRQWFKARVGTTLEGTPRAVSFCGHAILGDGTFVVDDATKDPRFHDNPLVTGPEQVAFYAGHPVRTLDGRRVGTLCVVDRRPRTLTEGEREALEALAETAADELSAHRVRLGSYRLLEVIGRGGMGVVYRAHDEGLGRTVAVKVVHHRHRAEARFLERFRREARALAAVTHPHVMTVFATGEERGVVYMVFEFLPGGTLLRRLRGGPGGAPTPLAPPAAARLGAQLASALVAVHEAGLVHRDVKPANVLYDARGRPKLGDFGLVRVHADPAAIAAAAQQARVRAAVLPGARDATLTAAALAATATGELTGAGGIVGTLATMAPEQARHPEAVDGRADLYALGATLFHALTGAPPVTGTALEIVTWLHGDDPCPAVASRAPAVPPALAAVVDRLLAKDPARRGTAEAAERDLEAAAP